MSRRVCDDELTLVCCKITIGDVNCDALLAFSGKPVHEERKIKRFALCAMFLGVSFKCGEEIVRRKICIKEQTTNKC